MAFDHEAYNKFYADVYTAQDHPTDGPHGWIQWKGTDACIDLWCACGDGPMHYDGDLFYFYECRACGRKYAVGQVVKLIELTPLQAAYIARDDDRFKRDTSPEAAS